MTEDLTARIQELLEEEHRTGRAVIGPTSRGLIALRITKLVVKRFKERDDRLIARIREALE